MELGYHQETVTFRLWLRSQVTYSVTMSQTGRVTESQSHSHEYDQDHTPLCKSTCTSFRKIDIAVEDLGTLRLMKDYRAQMRGACA
jgi:hypothetical protein